MMIICAPVHLLCASCGEELRTLEGTNIPYLDLVAFYNAHRCHARSWAADAAGRMPTKYRAIPHGRIALGADASREQLPLDRW
jgi:hypothetical protein